MKNFFKGISFSSIFAGALAAVTSFLLSAKIGIAGSVIGVAAGSIVSAVATQVYKNVLKASGEKLQNAVPFVANDKDGTDGAGKSGDDATTVIAPAESEGEQTKTLSAEESDETTVMTSVDGDTTTAMPATSGRVISSAQAGGRESNMLPDNAGGSIQHAGRRASFDAWLHGKRAPIVIAIVSALIGVAVSAGLILAFTGGHGTDTVVRDMVNSKQTPSDDNAGDSTYGSGNNGTQDNMQNQSGTTDTDKDSTTNSDRNNGKDTGKKTDSTTGGTGTSTDGSDSSTNTGDDSNKTDSSTDSTTPSDGSTSGTNNSGQSGAGDDHHAEWFDIHEPESDAERFESQWHIIRHVRQWDGHFEIAYEACGRGFPRPRARHAANCMILLCVVSYTRFAEQTLGLWRSW